MEDFKIVESNTLDNPLLCTNPIFPQIKYYPWIDSAPTDGFQVTLVIIISDMSFEQ